MEPYVTLLRHTALPTRNSLKYRNPQRTKSLGESARTRLSQTEDRRLCPRIRLYFRQANVPAADQNAPGITPPIKDVSGHNKPPTSAQSN